MCKKEDFIEIYCTKCGLGTMEEKNNIEPCEACGSKYFIRADTGKPIKSNSVA